MNNTTPPPLRDLSPAVAVVTPVYNTEPYLPESLASFAAQTYGNITFFIVDDGSTDGSPEILDCLAESDKRFVIIHQKNSGQSAARNRALCEIEQRGNFEFVAFADSDDLMGPAMIEKMVRQIQTDGTDCAVCQFEEFGSARHRLKSRSISSHQVIGSQDFITLILSLGETFKGTSMSGGMVWKQLYKAEPLKGLRFVEDRDTVEDELFNIDFACRAGSFSLIPETLYRYRARESGLTYHEKIQEWLFKSKALCAEHVARSSLANANLVASAIRYKLAMSKSVFYDSLFPMPCSLLTAKRCYDSGLLGKKDFVFSFVWKLVPFIARFAVSAQHKKL